jgi:hypothetical protein
MGNQITKVSKEKNLDFRTCFIIERILDANCDYIKNTSDKNLKIGVTSESSENKENPMNIQGIRIGEGEIYRLKNFIKNDNSLTYEFDKNIKLNLFKREMNVCYNLNTDDINITKCIEPIIIKNFKDIGMDSNELDEIAKFYK